MARTIDNLGVDSSTRYAEDQQRLDPNFIKDLQRIPVKPQVDVTQAFYASELDTLLDLHKLAMPWATFQAPKGYFEQKKALFTERLIPILGTEEKLAAEMQRIKENIAKVIRSAKEKEGGEKREDEKESDVMKWEEGRQDDDDEKEKRSLIDLLECITLLDRLLSDVNGRRNQYQKG